MKARVQLEDGSWAERIPAWIKWATQEWNEIQYNGVYYEPQVPPPLLYLPPMVLESSMLGV